MALQEEFQKQGYNLISSARAVPLFILILGYILLGAIETYPEHYYFQKSIYEEVYEWACFLVTILGFTIILYTNGYASNTSLSTKLKSDENAVFNTNGAYSVLRHPVYHGTFIMWLGPAFVTGNIFFIISFLLFCCIFFERMLCAEEHYLRKKIGIKYSRWANSVPIVIPIITNFKKPNTPFNWKSSFKKSIGKLSLVMIAFFLFDSMTEILVEKPNYNILYRSTLTICIVAVAIIKMRHRNHTCNS